MTLDEPITANGHEWVTFALAERLTGVPHSTIRQWAHRGHIQVIHIAEYGPMLRLDQVQDRERRWRDEPNRTTKMSDPLAMLPGVPDLPC